MNKINIIPNDVKNNANGPIFNGFSDSIIMSTVNDAKNKANDDHINGNEALKRAVINYTCHLLYLKWFDSHGGVTSSSIVGQSTSISNPHQNGDVWLNTYQEIANNHGNPNDGMQNAVFL